SPPTLPPSLHDALPILRWSADQALRRILPEQTITADFREASGRLQLGELSLDDSWSGLHLDAIQEATGVRIAFVTRFGEGVLPRSEEHTSELQSRENLV